MKDPITCQPEIRWEDASFWLRMHRRCYFPVFVVRACWNIGNWLIRGASMKYIENMTRWQVLTAAWRSYMAMYAVGVKREYLSIDEAMGRLREP